MFPRQISKTSNFLKVYNRALLTVDNCKEFCSSDAKVSDKKISKRSRNTFEKINVYLKSTPVSAKIANEIPEKYLHLKKKDCISLLYLLDESIANRIVSNIEKILGNLENKLICETNAGFGLITKRLLWKGARLRVYETCPEFRKKLKVLCKNYVHKTELYTKDLFHLNVMSYIDKLDQGSRVQQLLNKIPEKTWDSDPAITIVGTLPQKTFISYLIRMVVYKSEIVNYGRVELFAIIRYRNYLGFNANPGLGYRYYTSQTVLFQSFFDYKFIERYDRRAFIPYEMKKTKSKVTEEEDDMCLVHMVLKKDLPIKQDHLSAFYYFVTQGYGRGKKRIIPTIESWLPDSGAYFLSSETLKKNGICLSIFTEFGELTPQQIQILFIEMVKNPNYDSSPFIALMEADLLKRETVESGSL